MDTNERLTKTKNLVTGFFTLKNEYSILKTDHDLSLANKDQKIDETEAEVRKSIESFITESVGVKKAFMNWLTTGVSYTGVLRSQAKNNLEVLSLMTTKALISSVDQRFPADYHILLSHDPKEGATLYKKFQKDFNYILKSLGLKHRVVEQNINFSIVFEKA